MRIDDIVAVEMEMSRGTQRWAGDGELLGDGGSRWRSGTAASGGPDPGALLAVEGGRSSFPDLLESRRLLSFEVTGARGWHRKACGACGLPPPPGGRRDCS